ncbi:ATP-binding protein [Nocardioides sp. zg-536]|uniref:Sensor-like histidine kinase SenX3 n=1 Tax=Nocardioides faecalis TaxID=2803858 RepID=A0A939BUB2_9ACTN|nr:ATP-binding protein [Nocardioides faecalis]MBM9458322.1 ATP-binding protein [Nocardioides faecalis]QVI58348.1 ATP-binding protein [Nocardioides faecalis]
MDATTQQALLAALLGALVTAGAGFAWYLSDRQQRRQPPAEEPVVPDGVAAVLSVLRSSAVVLDESDTVLKASAPAYAMGFVRGTDLLSDELAEVVHQVRRDGQIRETELVVPRPGGLPRHVVARVAPLGSRLVLALVEDRTRERRVEEVRRDFVANVSHELKTPVGAVRILAEAVQDAADDPEAVHHFASRMLTESERLARLVGQIIELSRLQGDEPLEHPTPVSIDEVVAAAVDGTQLAAAAKDIAVLAEGEAGLKVVGSEKQVGAAVANLVANAVAYSEPTSRVVVTRRRVGDDVEISVIDRGIGIPEAEVERIFERFYRVDPARHRSTGGTGLGLSIVKHVAATHGGDVRVWSVEGQGSTFTLTLPVQPERHTAPAQHSLAPKDTPPPHPPAGTPQNREEGP